MKNSDIKKQVILGFLIGLVLTAIGFYTYTQVIKPYSFKFVKKLILEEDMLSTFLIYASAPNLLAFFVFIKRKEDYKARGVLLATFSIAIFMLISKFIF